MKFWILGILVVLWGGDDIESDHEHDHEAGHIKTDGPP